MKEEEAKNKSSQENGIDDIKVVNESEILSDEAQESVDGGVNKQDQMQNADDWCICNNLTINRTPESR